jgi:hypothetical protein
MAAAAKSTSATRTPLTSTKRKEALLESAITFGVPVVFVAVIALGLFLGAYFGPIRFEPLG